MNLLETNSEEVKAMGKTPHLVALLTALLIATVMSVILHWSGIDNVLSAIGLGVLLWIGVTLPDSIPHYHFAKVPFGVLILDTLHMLAMLCMAAFVSLNKKAFNCAS